MDLRCDDDRNGGNPPSHGREGEGWEGNISINRVRVIPVPVVRRPLGRCGLAGAVARAGVRHPGDVVAALLGVLRVEGRAALKLPWSAGPLALEVDTEACAEPSRLSELRLKKAARRREVAQVQDTNLTVWQKRSTRRRW